MRMMQHKLREEERDLMRSSCEKTVARAKDSKQQSIYPPAV